MVNENRILTELLEPDINQPLAEIYKHYCEGVVIFIRSNGGDEQDGYDIFQESILALVQAVKNGKFRGESSIKTFIYAIAKNKWLSEIRSRQRRNKREDLYGNQEGAASNDVHYNIYDREMNMAIEHIFKNIGDTCQKILRMFYYENSNIRDMMKAFDYENEQVLRNKKSLCLKKVKALLEADSKLSENMKTILVYGT